MLRAGRAACAIIEPVSICPATCPIFLTHRRGSVTTRPQHAAGSGKSGSVLVGSMRRAVFDFTALGGAAWVWGRNSWQPAKFGLTSSARSPVAEGHRVGRRRTFCYVAPYISRMFDVDLIRSPSRQGRPLIGNGARRDPFVRERPGDPRRLAPDGNRRAREFHPSRNHSTAWR